MIKIFWGGAGGGDTFKTPSPPTNNFCIYPPPVLRCFWKDPLMTPTTPLQASFTATPSPSTTPCPPKNFDHTHDGSHAEDLTSYLIIDAGVQAHQISGKLSDRILWSDLPDIFCSVQAPNSIALVGSPPRPYRPMRILTVKIYIIWRSSYSNYGPTKLYVICINV